jgi:hypothetical protein
LICCPTQPSSMTFVAWDSGLVLRNKATEYAPNRMADASHRNLLRPRNPHSKHLSGSAMVERMNKERLQPCHMALALMRLLAPEVRLSKRPWRTQAQRERRLHTICLERRASAAKQAAEKMPKPNLLHRSCVRLKGRTLQRSKFSAACREVKRADPDGTAEAASVR